ncbi:MAG: (d)CMP kinase [Deltaproteobacteria bacterium]|nr:MAG: (d)CMP kinase [Deltaproteobacteria bacterium]
MNKIITIDGPVASGKSTVSRLLAKRLNLLYLDTGAMYRAAALQANRMDVDFGERQKLWELCRNLDLRFRPHGEGTKLYLGEEDISLAIRTPEMDMLSSRISAIREVRVAMTGLQRRIGQAGRLVAEGRDMGTVVFPAAEHKFFITASTEVRTERRYRERIGRGESVSMEEVKRELKKRDHQDETRSIAPLRPAKGAKIIDTTALDPDQVVEKILENIKAEKD